jgi:hypothetical protein
MRNGGKPSCEAMPAPMRDNGSRMRRIGRRDSEESPA